MVFVLEKNSTVLPLTHKRDSHCVSSSSSEDEETTSNAHSSSSSSNGEEEETGEKTKKAKRQSIASTGAGTFESNSHPIYEDYLEHKEAQEAEEKQQKTLTPTMDTTNNSNNNILQFLESYSKALAAGNDNKTKESATERKHTKK